ncbi:MULTISPECIES: hypothetical protein [Streptacidiphilus]|uniref:Uncharacterized protein n=2 Tax=Streptacidiphilus TaxID=228398 RepID=A0ABV6UM60_9ACTN|nr:hypothetical protein [Streptacidiphilus jeojiense]
MNTAKSIFIRRAGSAAVVAALAAGGLAVGAGSASAKSAISVGVSARTVAVGHIVRVSASGSSDDFGATPIQLCIDEKVGSGAWKQLACTNKYNLALNIRAPHRGELQFRSQLIAVFNAHHRVLDRTSGTDVVQVR